jgi:ferrochelatase
VELNKMNDSAILLVQIGSPRSAEIEDVKNYQRIFLSDPFVVSPRPIFWKQILEYFILPKRSVKTAALYKEMLEKSENGEMPIFYNTRILAQKIDCAYCFLYDGKPSPKEALQKLQEQAYKKIIVFPLHPQRGGATTEAACSAVLKAAEELKNNMALPKLEFFAEGFAGEDFYIDSQVQLIEKTYKEAEIKPTDIIFSFHGYPKKRAVKEKYLSDCETTVRLICKKLSFKSENHIAFQSKFNANGKWLAPSTENIIETLAKKKASVMVVCPGFVSDNLETVMEIDKDLRQIFESSGGNSWSRVPWLNVDEFWVAEWKKILLSPEKISIFISI